MIFPSLSSFCRFFVAVLLVGCLALWDVSLAQAQVQSPNLLQVQLQPAVTTYSVGAPISGRVVGTDNAGNVLLSHIPGGPLLSLRVTLVKVATNAVVSTTLVNAGANFTLSTQGQTEGAYIINAVEDVTQSELHATAINITLAPTPTLTLLGSAGFARGGSVLNDAAPHNVYSAAPTQIGLTKPYPITYQTGTNLAAGAYFTVSPDTATQLVRIKGEGGGYTFPETDLTPQDGGVSYTFAMATPALGAGIQTNKSFDINWKYFRDSDQTWVSAGTSQNKLYVTLSGSSGLETVIDIANRGTQGLNGSDPVAVFNGVWSQFAGAPGTPRADGTPMKYWGAYSIAKEKTRIGFTKEDLISNADGRCQSWQGLMIAALNLQNTSSSPVGVIGRSAIYNGVEYEAKGIAVKSTVLGQGGTNDALLFINHAIVRSDTVMLGALYDPSYGKSYETTNPKNDWENASLKGVLYKFNPGDTSYNYDVVRKTQSPNDLMCNYLGY